MLCPKFAINPQTITDPAYLIIFLVLILLDGTFAHSQLCYKNAMQNKWWLTDVDRTHSKRASRIWFLPAASGILSLSLSHSLGLSIGVRGQHYACVSEPWWRTDASRRSGENFCATKKSLWPQYHCNSYKSCNWSCTGIRLSSHRKQNQIGHCRLNTAAAAWVFHRCKSRDKSCAAAMFSPLLPRPVGSKA